MPDLELLLRDSIGEIAEIDVSSDVALRVSQRRRRRFAGLAAAGACTALAIVAGVVAIAGSNGPGSVEAAGGQDQGTDAPLFSTPTGAVLVIDDGYDGVTALDLDTGVVGRRAVDGQRAGDQPFRLFRAADSLIVGWDEVFAAPLSGQASVPLNAARQLNQPAPPQPARGPAYAIPAVEAGAVWLTSWSGGGVGQGDVALALVDTDGNVLVEGPGPPGGGNPTLGVSGGIAVKTSSGLVLWDVRAQTAITTLEGGTALAATAQSLVWCDGSCDAILVRDLGTGEDARIALPDGVTGVDPDPANAALAPDGSTLAIFGAVPTTELTTASDTEGDILVVDLARGTVTRATDHRVPYMTAPRWSADGRFVLWATYSYGGTTTEVGRYEVATGSVEARRLPLGGAVRMVVVERGEARAFLPPELGRPEACRPPAVQPSERVGVCGFRVTAGDAPPIEVPSTVADQDATFVLTISNQSFEEPSVLVAVLIDGRPVITQVFEVRGQHTFVDFGFDLEPGEHALSASSVDGTTVSGTVVVPESQSRYGTLTFGTDNAGRPHLDLQFMEQAPVFG